VLKLPFNVMFSVQWRALAHVMR